MIVNKIGFGVYINDEFGEAIDGLEPLQECCDELGFSNTDWSFYCPSVESPQYVLGFKTDINKNTNFKELTDRWYDMLKNAPNEVQDAWAKSGSPEPDVTFLSGNC